MSFPRFGTSCNVTLVLFHVTDIVCFYVKTVFMFQKTKKKNKTKQNLTQVSVVAVVVCFFISCLFTYLLYLTSNKYT